MPKDNDMGIGRRIAKLSPRTLPDKDRDGVPNMFDCQPNNPHKQGVLHDLGQKAREKWQEHKKESAYKRAAEEQIKKKQKAAYYKAKEGEAIKYAQERAKIERQQKIKRLKSSGTSGGWSGLVASAGSRVVARSSGRSSPSPTFDPVSGMWSDKKPRKKTTRRRRSSPKKRKKKGKSVTIRLA